ncbi:MAG: hypothetical protein FWE05_08865 [Defluviitaleaceae bacterium]|nr:hypothetical protein [Defluviitaleaceae bacterium]
MYKLNLPGKTLIFVTSIILLVGGGINILTSVPMLLSSSYWDAVLPIFIPWSIWYAYALILSGYMLFMSISGIRFCNNPEKANFLFTLGIISVIFAVITLIFNILILGNLFLIVGLLMPILFLVGASKNKRYQAEMGNLEDTTNENKNM